MGEVTSAVIGFRNRKFGSDESTANQMSAIFFLIGISGHKEVKLEKRIPAPNATKDEGKHG